MNGSGPKRCERFGTEKVRTVRDRKGATGSGPKKVRTVRDRKGANGSGPKKCERFGTERV